MKKILIVLLALSPVAAIAQTNYAQMEAMEEAMSKKPTDHIPDVQYSCSHQADNGFVTPDIPLIVSHFGADRAVMFNPNGDVGDIFEFKDDVQLDRGVYDVSRNATISLSASDNDSAIVNYKTAEVEINYNCVKVKAK
ncbi:hypothetical protein ACCW94_02905 [Enterobacter soli]|uniref:hypothetical protein n=1 Tax=Enterobacter soli TaxID=885040 RepID=UPI003EDA4378